MFNPVNFFRDNNLVKKDGISKSTAPPTGGLLSGGLLDILWRGGGRDFFERIEGG